MAQEPAPAPPEALPAAPNADLRPLWPLALAAGLLPLAATTVAWHLSVQAGLVPSCNPFLEGCTSISRAARHDLPNILFRALILPAAVLQGLVWWASARWVRELGLPHARARRALPWIAVVVTLALVAYGTFLGTEGEGYRWMRRYGIVAYFGGTAIGMLIVGDDLRRSTPPGTRWHRLAMVVLAAVLVLPLLGLSHVLLPPLLDDATLKDRLENLTEWWAGAIFTLFFVVLALLWRQSGFGLAFGTRRGSAPTAARRRYQPPKRAQRSVTRRSPSRTRY